mgnify:CR=1 FL=1
MSDLESFYREPSPTRTAYLSGPMKDIPLNNWPLFEKLAAVLREQGWAVISPVDINRAAGIAETDNDFNEEQMVGLVRGDINAILSLRPSRGDAVIVMEDWFKRGAKSRGVFAELALADWLGLEIFLLIEHRGGVYSLHRLIRDRDTNVWLYGPSGV